MDFLLWLKCGRQPNWVNLIVTWFNWGFEIPLSKWLWLVLIILSRQKYISQTIVPARARYREFTLTFAKACQDAQRIHVEGHTARVARCTMAWGKRRDKEVEFDRPQSSTLGPSSTWKRWFNPSWNLWKIFTSRYLTCLLLSKFLLFEHPRDLLRRWRPSRYVPT